MRKFLKGLLIAILISALAVCGFIAWSWYSVSDTPPPNISIEGLSPHKVSWKVPIFFGLIEREFSYDINTDDPILDADEAKPHETLLLTQAWSPSAPEGYDAEFSIFDNTDASSLLFKGNADEVEAFTFPHSGIYEVKALLTKPRLDNNAHGTALFRFIIQIDDPPPPPPALLASAKTVVQGDVLAIELQNVPNGQTPQAQTELGKCVFVPRGEGKWNAFIGVGDAYKTGDYTVKVSFDDFEEELPVTVSAGNFGRQDLWIDTTTPSISEANSPKAYQQYRDTIPAFYETADLQVYWNGSFVQPVEGRLSSEYGLLRYTNGGSTPRRHSGIDLAVAQGTPIQAPAAGRVVYSDYLLNTGNTLVIEHGGGLKTYYFHLEERSVNTDEMVEQGQMLGKVGTTGYSTGPHLHFEVRIANQNLDPFKFFNGTGGCFTLE